MGGKSNNEIGINYMHYFWRFWVPHPFEKQKHKYKLYWRTENSFKGVI